MALGQRLRQLREERGLTQAEVGEVLGFTKAAIYGYEAEHRSPNPEALKKLATFFDVSTDYLLGLDENRRSVKQHIADSLADDVELLRTWKQFLNKGELQIAFEALKDLDEPTLKKIVKVIKAFIGEEEGSN